MNSVTTTELSQFERIVLPHQRYLSRGAVCLTGSRAEAEDLVQETLLKAYRAFDRLRPDSDIRPWLMCILRNTFISSWRKRKRELALLHAETCVEDVPWLAPRRPFEEPGRRMTDGLGDEIVAALDEVPQSYRALVVLVDLEQKTYREAAVITNQPLGTVQSRLFRGRRMLKRKLADYARREGYLARAA